MAAGCCAQTVQKMKNNPLQYLLQVPKTLNCSAGLSDAAEIDDSIRLPVSAACAILPCAAALVAHGWSASRFDLFRKGRQAAAKEIRVSQRTLCSGVTIACTEDLPTSVQLASNHLFGSLSCTVVAPETTGIGQAVRISQVRYGLRQRVVRIGTWQQVRGAPFPEDRLEAVESGIGPECFFHSGR
jgi:hypothetical protein